VEDWDFHALTQFALDIKTIGGFDVFEVNAAKSGLECRNDFNQLFGVFLIDLDVKYIDAREFLNRTALPSMTGLLAKGPMSPRPKTAVPLVTTPTKLPRLVYLKAAAGSLTISSQGAATPGVYAKAKSCWFTNCLVAVTAIFPGVGNSWYSSAALRN
jgi:hypothetical protein